MKLQGDSVGDLHTPALDPNPLNQSQVQIGQDPLEEAGALHEQKKRNEKKQQAKRKTKKAKNKKIPLFLLIFHSSFVQKIRRNGLVREILPSQNDNWTQKTKTNEKTIFQALLVDLERMVDS